jgi:hypothetical protein
MQKEESMRQKNGMKIQALLFCLSAVMIGLFLGGASTWAGDDDVIVYEDTNFGGKQLKFTGSQTVSDLRQNPLVKSDGTSVNWNDQISSISVGKNKRIVMYPDINLKGVSITFYGPTVCQNVTSGQYSSMPSGWNDRVSSFVVQANDLPSTVGPTADNIQIFSDINYCGSGRRAFGVGDYPRLTTYEIIINSKVFWNDQISSIRVGSNVIFTPFEHIDYGGASFSEVGPSNMPNLVASGWNDKISSFKVKKKT